MLAQALLAERSAEDIAAALARLYRARLPSPEDIIDPGEHRSRPARIAAERDSRAARARMTRRAAIEDGKAVGASRMARAASGFAPRSAAARMRKRAGCCR
jgi:ATP-dependent RNA helicase DeaD